MAAPVSLSLGVPKTVTLSATTNRVRAVTVPAGARHLRVSSTSAFYRQGGSPADDDAWTEADTFLFPAGCWDLALPGMRGTAGLGDVLGSSTTFYFVNSASSQKLSFEAVQE